MQSDGRHTGAFYSVTLVTEAAFFQIGGRWRGFDFLGHHFNPAGLTVAHETFVRFVTRATRLYEQEPGEALASARLGLYVRRCLRWLEVCL